VWKSFGYIGNTVNQLRAVASSEQSLGECLYLADTKPLEVGAWADCIRELDGKGSVPRVPLPALRALAKAGDLTRRLGAPNPPLTTFRLDNLLTDMIFDTSPIQRIMGDTDYSVRDGVVETLAWIRDSR
jgi:hypothetical protein